MLDTIEDSQIENIPLFSVRYTTTRQARQRTAWNKYGTSVMARIARESGGEEIDAEKKDLKDRPKIGEELRSSYETGHNSTNTERDGYFRIIVIRSNIRRAHRPR